MANESYCGFAPGVHCEASAILQATSVAAERFFTSSSLDRSMTEVLEQLGRATHISRACIFENEAGDTGEIYVSLRAEWAAQGLPSRLERPELKNLAMNGRGLARWAQTLGQGQLIQGAIYTFPPAEAKVLSGQGIKSLLAVPIFVGSEWWGTFELHDCLSERPWLPLEMDATRAIAGMLGGLIQRRRSEDVERKLAQVKDDFIASLSHELRTPLYAITGFVELLQKNKVKDPVVQQEFMGRISQNADRLVALVDELLDASRLEAGRIELDLADVNIGEMVSETLASLESLGAKKNLVITTSITGGGDRPIIALADRQRLKQVLVNIVGNAIKFSPPAGRIGVRVSARDGQVRVETSDQGPGIPPDDLSLLFTKFYRTETSVKNAVSGTGLGLYISKMIMDSHGGSIGVQSIVGQGSTFYFALPLKATVEAETEPVESSSARKNYGTLMFR
jgi:signal transduction histidine kinase